MTTFTVNVTACLPCCGPCDDNIADASVCSLDCHSNTYVWTTPSLSIAFTDGAQYSGTHVNVSAFGLMTGAGSWFSPIGSITDSIMRFQGGASGTVGTPLCSGAGETLNYTNPSSANFTWTENVFITAQRIAGAGGGDQTVNVGTFTVTYTTGTNCNTDVQNIYGQTLVLRESLVRLNCSNLIAGRDYTANVTFYSNTGLVSMTDIYFTADASSDYTSNVSVPTANAIASWGAVSCNISRNPCAGPPPPGP